MKKISLLVLILFLTIILFELFLRFSPFSYGITPMIYDKDIGMWHKKDFSNYIIKDCYKTKYYFDSYGRIENNYKYDDQKKDIVLMGDSQVEALMVNNKNIMHNSLFNELDGKYNVLNYGLSGTGPSQQLEILKHKVNLKNIDTLVHFIFLENDLNDGDPNNFNGSNRPKVYTNFINLNNYKIIKPIEYNLKESFRDFLGKFELYVYLKKTLYFYKIFLYDLLGVEKKTTHIVKHNIRNEKYKWLQLEGSLYQIKKITKNLKINYNIVIVSNNVNNMKKLEIFLNNYHIKYLNLSPFLLNLQKQQQISFSCDGHWNGVTHKEIAKYLKGNLNL